MTTLDVIQAVIDLGRERDELHEVLDKYESWFEEIVGSNITLTIKNKRSTFYVSHRITQFLGEDGWEIMSNDDDETVRHISINDFFTGVAKLEN